MWPSSRHAAKIAKGSECDIRATGSLFPADRPAIWLDDPRLSGCIHREQSRLKDSQTLPLDGQGAARPVRAEGGMRFADELGGWPSLRGLGLRRGQADDFARRAGMRLKFVPQHQHIRRGFDPEPDLVARNPHNGQND
jgi:hypothetical protein